MTSGPAYDYIPPQDKEEQRQLLISNTYHKSTLYIYELNEITNESERTIKIQLWQRYVSTAINYRKINPIYLNTFFTSLQNNSPTLMTDLFNLLQSDDACNVFQDYLFKVLRKRLTKY